MIDTLYTLRTIPIATTIRDSIITKTTIGGNLEIGVQDSLNFVLSGSPTIMLEMPKEINWSAILGIISVVVNALLVFYSLYQNRKLQQCETEELRKRKIQEIAITQQAEMYRLLQELTNVAQDFVDPIDIQQPAEQKKFKKKVYAARTFFTQNTIYIREPLETIVTEVLDIYDDPNFVYDIDTIKKIEDILGKYCDIYNK